MPKETVGDRIAQARREKGVRDRRDVKPVDLARALDVSGATVSDWEAGKIKPRDDAMLKLADYLGVDPGWLRYGGPAASPGAPMLDPSRDRRLTESELDRADAQAARDATRKTSTKKPRKRNQA